MKRSGAWKSHRLTIEDAYFEGFSHQAAGEPGARIAREGVPRLCGPSHLVLHTLLNTNRVVQFRGKPGALIRLKKFAREQYSQHASKRGPMGG